MVELLFMLVVIGAIAWWVRAYAPIHDAIKAIIVTICVLWCAYLVLRFLGLIGTLPLGSMR